MTAKSQTLTSNVDPSPDSQPLNLCFRLLTTGLSLFDNCERNIIIMQCTAGSATMIEDGLRICDGCLPHRGS